MNNLTVKDLIEQLKKCDQESYVALSADSEGNSYSIMGDEQFITNEVYLQDDFNKQEQFFEKSEVESKDDPTVQDFDGNLLEKEKLVKCVLLWPCN